MLRSFSPCRFSLAALTGIMGLLLVAGGGPRIASAQTPTTTIQNGNGDTRLELNYDGGLYVPGTFDPVAPADSIPAEGAGTRLMWYPAKAAFRAGRVGLNSEGTQWDASNVGQHSTAFGVNTKASSFAATAVGWNTTASEFNATAMGWNTTASGDQATAMGRNTTASGSQATAMGRGTIASGFNATAMGQNTTAASDNSLSIGRYNSANTSSDLTLLVAGNGGSGSPSNALVLKQDGDLEISGTLTESSDRRLKTDIKPLETGTLQKLEQIRPVRYEFTDQTTHPNGPQMGLIAQDVRKEFPSLVSTGTNGMLSLTYSKFTAVLLKGLQEQQDQINTQKSQIADLRAENDAMKAQQKDLKERLAALEAQSGGSILAGSVSISGFLLALMALGGLLGTGLLWRHRP